MGEMEDKYYELLEFKERVEGLDTPEEFKATVNDLLWEIDFVLEPFEEATRKLAKGEIEEQNIQYIKSAI